MQSGKSSAEVSNPTSSKPGDDDDDDEEPAEDMDEYVESGRLEAEDNVLIDFLIVVLISDTCCLW